MRDDGVNERGGSERPLGGPRSAVRRGRARRRARRRAAHRDRRYHRTAGGSDHNFSPCW